MRFIAVLICFIVALFLRPAWAVEKWCLQSPVYPSAAEAMKEAKKLPGKKAKVEKHPGGFILLLGEFDSEKEARAQWEKAVSILPGSVIRRCDEIPSLALPVPDDDLFVSALRKKKAGDYSSALADFKKALGLSKGSSGWQARILYEMAHCYEALKEKELARETFRQAIDKGPQLGVAPADILYEEGFKAYKRREFSRAIKIFSHYAALYPDFRLQAYYFMACSFMEMKQFRPAMHFFDYIIKEDPSTPYAIESTLALGNIGLVRPKVKVPLYLSHFGYAWDPISAYNEVLRKEIPPERRDQIILSKAYGYLTMGYPELAHKVLVDFVRKFAAGPYRAQARLILARNLPAAIQAYENKKDDLAVVGVFFQSLSLNLPFPTNISTIRSIAQALKNMGFKEELQHFLKAARVKVASQDVPELERMMAEVNKPAEGKVGMTCEDYYRAYESVKARGSVPSTALTLSVADCRFRAGDYGGSIPYYDYVAKYTLDGGEKAWAQLRLGQANLRLGKKEEAASILGTLKAEAKEEFWARLAEFTETDEKWMENYRMISRGRLPGTTSPSP